MTVRRRTKTSNEWGACDKKPQASPGLANFSVAVRRQLIGRVNGTRARPPSPDTHPGHPVRKWREVLNPNSRLGSQDLLWCSLCCNKPIRMTGSRDQVHAHPLGVTGDVTAG